MHLLKVISEEERQGHLHPQCVCRGTKRKPASSFALAGAAPAIPWPWEPASSCCSPPLGSDPGAEGAGREPLSSLTQRCWSSRHIGSVQEKLGAVVCSPASAHQELPPASPAPDTVAANQTALWVLVSFNSSAGMDGGTGAGMDGREHSLTAFPMSLPIPVIKPAAVESL